MDVFLRTWKDWAETVGAASPDQSLPEDRTLLSELAGAQRVVRWGGWRDCQEQFDPWDKRAPIHTGLVPLPFVGDVRRAKVYFLLLNPGLSATDYYAEYEADGFRQRLLSNLRQDFAQTEYPFFPLDPRCAWHSGNAFWERKLKHLLLQLCERSGHSHAQVRKFLAKNICAIEMLPYHSVRLDVPGKYLARLRSCALARECVGALVPQARDGHSMLVAMRQVDVWQVPLDCKHIVRFSAGEARGAHLSTKEGAAGRRVADFLLPHLKSESGQIF
ncbi:hypothetical protein SAMN05444746_1166 [Variovorax sp. OK212]|nr:hypothetical protein SAMN05518853_1166 [Variovorax sp. OK202]SFE06209.1 hypothetical protein SAMN05444746_1166 [Variovorax sp. OK212]